MTIKQLESTLKTLKDDELYSDEAVLKFWDGCEYREVTEVEFHEHGDGECHLS